MDSVWIQYGFSMDSVWIQYGFSMDSVWIQYGFSMDSVWIQYGRNGAFAGRLDVYSKLKAGGGGVVECRADKSFAHLTLVTSSPEHKAVVDTLGFDHFQVDARILGTDLVLDFKRKFQGVYISVIGVIVSVFVHYAQIRGFDDTAVDRAFNQAAKIV
jgi:hypothetical protein